MKSTRNAAQIFLINLDDVLLLQFVLTERTAEFVGSPHMRQGRGTFFGGVFRQMCFFFLYNKYVAG